MSALRKPKPSELPASWPYLDEADRTSWDEFVKSLTPKLEPTNLRYWARVQPQRKLDDLNREISPLDPTIWGGSRGRC